MVEIIGFIKETHHEKKIIKEDKGLFIVLQFYIKI